MVIAVRKEADVTLLNFVDGALNLGISDSVVPESTGEWALRYIPFVPSSVELNIQVVGTLQMKRLSIYKGLISSSTFSIADPSQWYHDTVPTAGTWQVGDVVMNDQPLAGEVAGWICSVAGNPGTWVSMASLT